MLLLAGSFQFIAGVARLGGLFRAISPAVVHGMLAGIGVLIFIGQFHVLFDELPKPNGVENLLAIPLSLLRLVTEAHSTASAFAAGVITIVTMLAWDRFKPATLRLIPGALVGVALATVVSFVLQLELTRVDVPESIFGSLAWTTAADFSGLLTPGFIATAVAVAFIASAETLISAAAVDRMHDGVRSDYNKELRAQGIGNFLCGAVGALPMTGVIVRSSANIQAGAMTRASAMLHGVWILAFVLGLPWLLREIPMASLAGVLVVTGWRLVSIEHVRHLYHHYGVMPALIWGSTLFMVVTTDLLTGVLTGLVLSLVELLPHLRNLKLDVQVDHLKLDSHLRLDSHLQVDSHGEGGSKVDVQAHVQQVGVQVEGVQVEGVQVEGARAEGLREVGVQVRGGVEGVGVHGEHVEVRLLGRATFLSLPGLTRVLDSLPGDKRIRLNVTGLALVDHTCAEVLVDWIQRRRKAGGHLELAGVEQVPGSHSHRRLAEAAAA